jgi:hypothetical protein
MYIPLVESKSSSDLVEWNQPRKLPGIHQEMVAQVFQVAVDEGLLDVKAESDNITSIVHTILHGILKVYSFLEDGLLVVRQHEHQGDIETLLEPLSELQGDCMS